MFICLVRQYCSTRYGQLITACSSFGQCISTFEYRSTRYRHSLRYVYLLSTLVPQYSIRTTHHNLFFICLVPQYVSTLVLGTDTHHGMFISQYVSTVVLSTDNSSRRVLHLFSASVGQYRSTQYGLFFICLVRQYVSTLVLVTDTHHGMFICLVGQYFSTRYGQLITACSSFVQCLSTLVP